MTLIMYLYVGFGVEEDRVELKNSESQCRKLATRRFEGALPQPADTNAYTVKMYNEIGIVCSVYYECAPLYTLCLLVCISKVR